MSTDYITIPLSKNGTKHNGKYEAIISIEDADLAELCWVASHSRYVIYADRLITIDGKRIKQKLHRVILGRKLGRELLPTEYVDHANGIGTDNRRVNLRLATGSQNQANSRKRNNKASQYKGVSRKKGAKAKQWFAQIRIDNKLIHLGYFLTEEEAYRAYCEKAKELFGEFANFGNHSE